MFKGAKKVQMVELVIAASVASAGARVYFQDQPQLRSLVNRVICIDAIETVPVTALAVSPLTTNAVANGAAIANGALVLNVNGYENLNLIPLAFLNRTRTSAAAYVPSVEDLYTFDNLVNVDWTKSYVQFGNAPAGTPFSYLFNVYYRELVPLQS